MKVKTLQLALFLLILAPATAFSQVGIGIGSNGLNVKTNPDARKGIIIRTGFGFSVSPWETFVHPEVAWIKRHHYSEKTKLYAGLGVTGEARINLEEAWMGYGVMVPVGLELFPLDDKRVSLTLETGLKYYGIGLDEGGMRNYGLIEITFYLKDREAYREL